METRLRCDCTRANCYQPQRTYCLAPNRRDDAACLFFSGGDQRLALIGGVEDGGFDFPLTQEMLGDALGLTPVHINRVLQHARQEGLLQLRERRVTIPNPEALADIVRRAPVRVQAAPVS